MEKLTRVGAAGEADDVCVTRLHGCGSDYTALYRDYESVLCDRDTHFHE